MDQIPPIFTDKFSAATLEALGQPPDEIDQVARLQSLALDKSPGPDGVLPEFFLKFWDVIGPDFTEMI